MMGRYVRSFSKVKKNNATASLGEISTQVQHATYSSVLNTKMCMHDYLFQEKTPPYMTLFDPT